MEFWQWPGLRRWNFGLLILWNNILIRLHKICIIGSTFTTHCGNKIEVRSYIDSMVETRVNVLMFAHGPHLLDALTAHGIEPASGAKSFKPAS